jgi:hypothetical protein
MSVRVPFDLLDPLDELVHLVKAFSFVTLSGLLWVLGM